ncbi:MAG: hypothetical protein STSR0008_22940 [Ignavibacterium sp.]
MINSKGKITNRKQIHYLLKKEKVLRILFVVALVLLTFNILIEKIYNSNNTNNQKKISSEEINNLFLTSIKNFSIDDSLIYKIKKSSKKIKAKHNYQIIVPADLPIPILLKDIYNIFSDYPIKIVSNEIEINNKSVLEIFSDKEEIYCEFIIDRKIVRNKGSIAFIINTLESLSNENISELLNSPEILTFAIRPSYNSEKLIKKVNSYSLKDVMLLLDDNITESDFELNSTFTKNKLRYNLSLIYKIFPSINSFLIDTESNLYNSQNYSFIKNELIKRKIKLYKTNDFNSINEKNKNNFFSSSINLPKEKVKIYFLNGELFLSLINEIVQLKKTGIKIVRLSSIGNF